MTPDVSVVVPTFRRPQLLARCLEALAQQHADDWIYEVIVSDDGNEPSIDAWLEDFERQLDPAQCPRTRWRCVRPNSSHGPAAARNAGWRAARAVLVAFTDDDTQPDLDWLQQGRRAMQLHPEWVALTGRVVVPRDGARPSDHALMTQGLERAEFVTANAFVRRDALQCIGGFDERFNRAWREDSDLQFRLMAVGAVGRCEHAVVMHPVRPAPFAVSLGQQRNAFYEALLYAKHPVAYRDRVERRPPWLSYVIVGSTLVGCGLALAGRSHAAGWAATLAAAGILAVAFRRLQKTSRKPSHVLEMLLTSVLIPFLSVYWRLRGAWHFKSRFL